MFHTDWVWNSSSVAIAGGGRPLMPVWFWFSQASLTKAQAFSSESRQVVMKAWSPVSSACRATISITAPWSVIQFTAFRSIGVP